MMTFNIATLLRAGLVATLISASNSAYAWTFLTCPDGTTNPKWSNPNQTWRANNNGTSGFTGGAIGSMQIAAGRINAIRRSNMNVTVTSNNLGTTPGYGNGNNDVWLDVNDIIINGAGRARMIFSVTTRCDNLNADNTFIETDIFFADETNWQGDPLNGGYAGALFAHEIGHAVGIGHDDTGTLALMNRSIGGVLGGPSGSEAGIPEFHGADAAALRTIYPTGGSGINLYTSKFKRGAAWATNNLVSRANNVLTTLANAPVGNVTSGTQYKLQYTVGNMGTSTRTFNVDMRYSTDSNIATSDPTLGSVPHTLASGQMAEGNYIFTMPALNSGQFYWFGYSITVSGDREAGDDRARHASAHFAN